MLRVKQALDMDYALLSYTGRIKSRELWRNFSLNAVRQHARGLIESGFADKVEIFDADGKLVARYPREDRST